MVRAFLRENPGFVLEKPDVAFGPPGPMASTPSASFRWTAGKGISRRASGARRRMGMRPGRTTKSRTGRRKRRRKRSARRFSRTGRRSALRACATASCCLPAALPALSGLGVLRAGVELGEMKKNRIEPAHGIFMAAKPAQCRSVLHLRHDDPRLTAFLRGEEIPAEGLAGYTAVAVEGVVTGLRQGVGRRAQKQVPEGPADSRLKSLGRMICAVFGKGRRLTKNENGAFTRVGPDGAGAGKRYCRRAQRPRLIRKTQKLCGMRKVLCLFFFMQF